MTYRPPIITVLNDSEFELVEPFVYEWEDKEDPGIIKRLTLPKGYTSNGASVPRIFWTPTGLIPTGVHLGPAFAHDYSYQRRGKLVEGEYTYINKNGGVRFAASTDWNRKKCDDLFLRIMKEAGETPWKANAMYWAVRIFGGKAWSN